MAEKTLISATDAMTGSLTLGAGTILGNWELVAVLGKGAMGRVYRARHVRLGREAAIKVLNPEYVSRPDVVQRFFREARVVNEIDHEHIVEVTDFVEAPGLAYLVMELLEGDSLRALLKLRKRRYPRIDRIVGIMREVCSALEAAHAKGVVHRDLKPDNVFVVKRNGGDFTKVLDFGVARLLDGGDDHESTVSGMIIGTPHYMSPEQALGKKVGRDADLWAAGVVLYEALAGSVPFSAPSFVELAMTIREKPPVALPGKTPRGERIPPWLAAVALKCLEKRPEERYRTMAQLAEALEGPRSARRRRLSLPALGLAAAFAAAIAAVKLDLPARARGLFASAAEAVKAAGQSQPPPAAGSPASEGGPASPRHAASEPRPPAPKPAARATVEVHVRSTPSGATVVRLDTGKRLGRTPLRIDVPRKPGTVWLQLRLDGYLTVKFAADLREDVAANLTLRRAKRTKSARR
jgi:serine/threonine-protein kinase